MHMLEILNFPRLIILSKVHFERPNLMCCEWITRQEDKVRAAPARMRVREEEG